MAITPWYVGQLAPAWTLFLVPDSGIANVAGLTSASFSLTIRNLDNGSITAGAGTFSSVTAAVTSTVNGQALITSHASVTYQPATADVSTPGNYHLYVNVAFGNGTEPFDLGSWEVVTK